MTLPTYKTLTAQERRSVDGHPVMLAAFRHMSEAIARKIFAASEFNLVLDTHPSSVIESAGNRLVQETDVFEDTYFDMLKVRARLTREVIGMRQNKIVFSVQDVAALADSAYSRDQYGRSWVACAQILFSYGFNAQEAVECLYSKHMRWAADGTSSRHPNSADLARYLNNDGYHGTVLANVRTWINDGSGRTCSMPIFM